MNNFSDTLNAVMDDNMINAEDFAVIEPTLDEVDCERDIMGTDPYDNEFRDDDENTCDMNALSPAFRELYDEYEDYDEDDDISEL